MEEEDEKRVQDVYAEISKQYSLPSFEEMDNLFEISSLETITFPIRNIRRHIVSHIDALLTELERIIQPDSTIHDMIDSRVMNDKEKEELFILVKHLTVFKKRSLLCDITKDDERDSTLINDIFKDYPNIREKIRAITEKLITAWESKPAKEEIAEYFG